MMGDKYRIKKKKVIPKFSAVVLLHHFPLLKTSNNEINYCEYRKYILHENIYRNIFIYLPLLLPQDTISTRLTKPFFTLSTMFAIFPF